LNNYQNGMNGGGRFNHQSYLANRRRVINEHNNNAHGNSQTLQEYKKQQEQFNKEKEILQAPPSFKKTRTMIIFRGQYLVIMLSFFLILINSILRGFSGVWWYLVPNLLFAAFYLVFSSYFNPLDYASDTKSYIRPKLDRVYLQLQEITKVLLTLLGHNLDKKPESSLRIAYLIGLVGTLTGILFYNSGFVVLSIPFILLFVVRSFASGKTIEAGSRLKLFKWVLFIFLLINSVLSAYWKTPFGFELVVVISIVNSLQLWLDNLEIYGVDVIARLKMEEERRSNETARMMAAQAAIQRTQPRQ
jgi:membrane protein